MRRRLVVPLGLLAVLPVILAAQTQINTTGAWDGQRQIGMFGAAPGFTVFGQSFTAPSNDDVLNDFSFWLNQGGGWQPNILFNAFVMAWHGTKASGPVLWESSTQSGPTTPMERYDFDVGSLQLAPDAQYIAFFSTIAQLPNFPSNAQVLMGYSFANPGGAFYSMLDVTNFNDVTSQAWGQDVGCPSCSAAFIADFSPPVTATPEPASLTLIATGFAGLGAFRSRRRRTRE